MPQVRSTLSGSFGQLTEAANDCGGNRASHESGGHGHAVDGSNGAPVRRCAGIARFRRSGHSRRLAGVDRAGWPQRGVRQRRPGEHRHRPARHPMGSGAGNHSSRQQARIRRRRHDRPDRAAQRARGRGSGAPEIGGCTGAGRRRSCAAIRAQLCACPGAAAAAHEISAVLAGADPDRHPHEHDHHYRSSRAIADRNGSDRSSRPARAASGGRGPHRPDVPRLRQSHRHRVGSEWTCDTRPGQHDQSRLPESRHARREAWVARGARYRSARQSGRRDRNGRRAARRRHRLGYGQHGDRACARCRERLIQS